MELSPFFSGKLTMSALLFLILLNEEIRLKSLYYLLRFKYSSLHSVCPLVLFGQAQNTLGSGLNLALSVIK